MEAGIENVVVNPGSLETAVHNRVKTDKRDAQKIASLLEAGRLKGIRVPTESVEHQRLLTRTREQFVQERTRIKNMIRMRSHPFGLLAPEDRRKMSHPWVKAILAKAPSPEFTTIIQAYWKIWQTLDTEIKALEVTLKRQAQLEPLEVTYLTAPGIGPLSSRILANELGDMSQFTNERQLFSDTGLTPSEHSSGDTIRRGPITRQGNPSVRHVLCESAWTAIRKEPDLRRERNIFTAYSHKLCKANVIENISLKNIGFRNLILNKRAKL